MPTQDDNHAVQQKASLFLDLWALNLSLWAQESPDKAQEILASFGAKVMAQQAAPPPPKPECSND